MGRSGKTVAPSKKPVAKPATLKRTRSDKDMDERVTCLSGNEDVENPPLKKKNSTSGRGRVRDRADDVEECFSSTRCISWFQSYATRSSTSRSNNGKSSGEFLLDSSGMEKFYQSIGVDPTDILALILSKKLGVVSMDGSVSQAQWTNFMSSISCDSDKKLRAQLPALLAEAQIRSNLLALCQYIFGLVQKTGERAISKDVALELFSMILRSSWAAFPLFAKFLESKSDCRGVTLDTFSGMCDISLKYPTAAALRHYDASQAWPSMADDFVEWIRTEPSEQQSDEEMA